jgi:hypothetical protein
VWVGGKANQCGKESVVEVVSTGRLLTPLTGTDLTSFPRCFVHYGLFRKSPFKSRYLFILYLHKPTLTLTMPPTPPTIPANLREVLSLVRSSVFMSTHNPSGSRLGTKYLTKPLRGPAILSYYPVAPPKVSTMNKRFAAEQARLEKNYLEGKGPHKQKGDIALVNQWKSEGQVAPGYTAVGNLPEALDVDEPFWDQREDDRLRRVEARKRLGKGPPKKSECWCIQ